MSRPWATREPREAVGAVEPYLAWGPIGGPPPPRVEFVLHIYIVGHGIRVATDPASQ